MRIPNQSEGFMRTKIGAGVLVGRRQILPQQAIRARRGVVGLPRAVVVPGIIREELQRFRLNDGGPLEGDYGDCMHHCVPENGFGACHSICATLVNVNRDH